MSGETNKRDTEKRTKFEQWFERDHVLIHLDSERQGVAVPASQQQNHSLTLKLSRLFQGETHWSEDSIRAYLKFDGIYEECVIPWTAIWGMTADNAEHVIWIEDLPKQVLVELARAKLKEFAGRFVGGKKSKRDKAPSASPAKASEKKGPPKGPQKPKGKADSSHLKLVK